MGIRFFLCQFFLLIIAFQSQFAQQQEPPPLERAYLDRIGRIGEEDIPSRLDLARWCLKQGYIREMLHGLDLLLEREPQHKEARRLLHQEAAGEAWAYQSPKPAVSKRPEPEASHISSVRERLLNAARNREFKLASKAVRFNFWTDLDRARIEDYTRLLNPYYVKESGD